MKEDTKEALEKIEKLRKEIESHPLAMQIKAEAAAAVLLTRTTAADQIKAIRKEQAETLPRLLSDLEGKEAKFKKAKAAMESAGVEFQTARATLSTENNNYSYSISHLEQSLIESADPALDAAIEFFREKLDWLRRPGRILHNAIGSERNIYTETVTVTSESNIPAINDALQFCREAIQALESMKLDPTLDLQKIERMKKAIPSIDIYSEATGEKPMENSKGRSFASYFKSEDQSNFEVSKLLKKADKLLSGKSARA